MLDTPTLMVVLAVMTGLNAIVAAVVHRKGFPVRGTGPIFWGYALMAVGILSLTARTVLPPVPGVLLPNLSIMTGFLVVDHGLRILTTGQGLPRGRLWAFVALVAATAALHYRFLVINPSLTYRIVIISFTVGVLAGDTSLSLFSHSRARWATKFMGGTFAFYAGACAFRAGFHLFHLETSTFFASRAVNLFFLGTMVFALGMILGLVFMISEEINSHLAGQNRILKENIRLRDDVESVTRHDLKAPITPVAQAMSVLLLDNGLSEGARELMVMCKRSALDALEMINRSLDIYKLEQGRYRLVRQPVDLAAQLDRAAADVRTALKSKKVEVALKYQGRPGSNGNHYVIQGESALIYSMMANLLKNAVEASPRGGRVTAALDLHPDTVTLRVENNGSVPDEVKGRMFDKFVTSGKARGAGLGAYSARLVAKEHGGNVSLDTSTPGVVRITVSLPRQTASTESPEQAA